MLRIIKFKLKYNSSFFLSKKAIFVLFMKENTRIYIKYFLNFIFILFYFYFFGKQEGNLCIFYVGEHKDK